jgi:hypothetical protein
LVEALKAVVRSFEPEWGGVTSDRYRELAPKVAAGTPQIGWITYLGETEGLPSVLTAGARVLAVDSLGSIIVTTEERFSSDKMEHLEAAESIRRSLERAGILHS